MTVIGTRFHACRIEDLVPRDHEWTEPHGERCYQQWYRCRECGSDWTQREADRLAEESELGDFMTWPKTYLGDAVYAAGDEWGRLILTTEDGIQATNTIVLEPEVLEALQQYIKTARDGGIPWAR